MYKRNILLRAIQRNAKIMTVISATFKSPTNVVHHTRSVTKVPPDEALLILIPSAPLAVLLPVEVWVPAAAGAKGMWE
jgi:hypothetical protein